MPHRADVARMAWDPPSFGPEVHVRQGHQLRVVWSGHPVCLPIVGARGQHDWENAGERRLLDAHFHLKLSVLFEEADIQILAEIQNEPEIFRVVDETRPDFLIIALDDSNERPVICDELLRSFPELKILAVAPERNSCMFFWGSFDIHSSPVEASEAGIIGTLRGRGQYV